ncbi:MAG: universal stress protein [Spirochaetaceae bacterium]|nr:universal stress protein [Spirochaetaceae bacterium]MCF7947646.1 universal stress protein [Spirochaetia bacterium]MCF7951380.1 universal stress protein [Spirochaetaceae bacterium]
MEGPIRRILIYVDGTEEAITAAQYAVCLAKSTGADLHALYVINTRALNDLVKARIFLDSEEEEYHHDLESDAERYLKHVDKLSSRKGVTAALEKRSGTVHQEIKKYAEEIDADVLLIGELSHVRSRRDEFYHETERAMRLVHCSVLMVKDEERVWDLYDALPE